jgi:outer membrane murein-binding lipoprotein Lpp
MKKHTLYSASIVLASFAIAAALVLVRRPEPVQNESSQQLKELRARIAQLETKATALQREMDQVRKEPAKVIYTSANELSSPPGTAVAREQVPPGWKPHEFNGMTYYFTLLGEKAEISLAPTK